MAASACRCSGLKGFPSGADHAPVSVHGTAGLQPDSSPGERESQPGSPRSGRGAGWRAAALRAAFAGTCLNLAASALDHPRAFAAPAHLLAPLVAGFLALAPGALLVFALAERISARRGLFCGPRAAAASVVVLGPALAPLVELALRGASPERAEVVLALAGGFLGAVAVALFALAERAGAGGAAFLRAERLAPLLSAAALVVAWCVEYGAALPSRSTGKSALEVKAALAADLPPAVLLITIDTLRADHVAACAGPGASPVPTPALDALAAESVVFANARSAAPWTKPALATLLTGLSPLVHGTTTRRAALPDEIETLAEHLARAGYRTGGIGLNAHLERAFHFAQGFDTYRFPARDDYGVALGARVLAALAPERYPELFPSTEALADEAIVWLYEHQDEPFFLWLHVLDPHWPYAPPAEWLAEPDVEPRAWGLPETVTDVQAGNVKLGARERERVRELYAGEIRYVDASVARVLGALRELGLYDPALIVLASDHGEEFWEHGRYEHGHTLYDEILRVPLFFKLPDESSTARLEVPVSTEALTPTVLDVLDLDHDPARFSSRSLRAWWEDPAAAVVEPLFATGTYYFGEKQAVILEGKKLVLELDTGRAELFDLTEDPRELFSLAAAEPGAVRLGRESLEAWMERSTALREELGIRSRVLEPGRDEERRLRALGYAGGAATGAGSASE